MGLQALDLRLQQIERGAQSTQMAVAKSDGAMERMAQQLQAHLAQVQADAQAGRSEQAQALGAFRQELSQLALRLGQEGSQARETAEQGRVQLSAHVQQRFEALAQTLRGTLDSLKSDVSQQLTHGTTTMGAALKDQLGSNGEQMRHQFAVLQDAVTQQLAGLSQSSQSGAEQLRATLNERLERIRSDNAQRLDEMRRTVDEKLHATLEQRLGESFKLVSDRLEQVHKGLGEMQTLAGSVGDLKRVMTNVKTRGTWGELQLGAIMENMLTPEQYAKNVKTVPGSDEMVEFAVRLPGKSDEAPVWLPIDAKYPVEAYQRLLDAQDAGDKAAMQAAGNAFESSIKLEAKKIYAKYVSPPHTTDFAVLYLPTEGLFAEVMRRPGLVEALHNECRVMMTGPANLAAMLSSLQMGFKTLAIEKRSSEVWAVLGQVKTEFAKFGEVVDATRKSIDAAARRFEQMGVRTRAIQRKLRDVQELPAPDPDDPLLGTGAPEDGEDGEG
ncbi:DNA recombination protein RmuC [Comamonas composti]|uniref:DNA recombination protein RmuC n=1 Tax=Comamonas composti TaxID=408558 RepID=UPI000A00EC74|nr:DNA recombination protein RmuC [Comamonas composti]